MRKQKKRILPIVTIAMTFLVSTTAFAADNTGNSARMPYDNFSFEASATEGNVLLVSSLAYKRVESATVGITPENYVGSYTRASVCAERMYWSDASQTWYAGHQATNSKYFSANNFQLNYNNDDDANSNGAFRLKCNSNAVDFAISGWWDP